MCVCVTEVGAVCVCVSLRWAVCVGVTEVGGVCGCVSLRWVVCVSLRCSRTLLSQRRCDNIHRHTSEYHPTTNTS